MTVVADWMSRVVHSGSWKRHDDLHLDAIVGGGPKGAWVEQSIRIVPRVLAARDEVAPTFDVILGFGLHSTSTPHPPAWSSADAFASDLDDSPPSLYMYERESPEWVDLFTDNVPVTPPPFLAIPGRARYRQVWDDQDREYRRSLLLVLQLPNPSLERP